MKQYTPKELDQLLDDVLNTQIGFMYPADFIEEVLVSEKSKEELIRDYINTLQTYYHYLQISDADENYELSDKIIRALDIEEYSFILLCQEYALWFVEGESEEEIRSIRTEYNKMYNVDGE